MTVSSDLQRTLAQAPLTRFQFAAIAVCVGLNMLDGFDILAMSFAIAAVAMLLIGPSRAH